jgi:polyhydroxyalkanoic acid synthase PhaR subunit
MEGKIMSEQTNQPRPDVMEAWREWLTQTERQFNAFFNEAMNAEPFARNMGGYVEATASLQRTMAEGMQRYLSFMNMPSRTDVTDLGETMRSIEDRLSRIEEMLQIAAEAVDMAEEREAALREPTRTRTPPTSPTAEVRPEAAEPPQGEAVPQGLRR